jgi:hypothetical protein
MALVSFFAIHPAFVLRDIFVGNRIAQIVETAGNQPAEDMPIVVRVTDTRFARASIQSKHIVF